MGDAAASVRNQEQEAADVSIDEPSAIPVLSTEEMLAASRAKRAGSDTSHMVALYSSYFGGITTDPAMMMLPLDDHGMSRGHCMFDTGSFRDGRFYRLGTHVDRLLRNCDRGKVPHNFSREQIIETIRQTVAATGLHNGAVRYYLTAGHGGWGWLPDECVEPGLYVSVIAPKNTDDAEQKPELVGVVEKTVHPMLNRPRFLAQTKSNNYLLNVMCAMDAVRQGSTGTFGIWVEEETDFVIEGAICSCVFVTHAGCLVTPRFTTALEGCTVRRILALGPDLVHSGVVKSFEQRDITAAEAKAESAEMFLCGDDTWITPVVQWDSTLFGEGIIGPVTRAIYRILCEEEALEHSEDHISIY